eukprot:tig00000042_g15443.t1
MPSQELPESPTRVRPITEPHMICDKAWNYKLRNVKNRDAPAEWLQEPAFKSRSELLEARKDERLAAGASWQNTQSTYRSKEWGVGTRANAGISGAHDWTGEVPDGDEAPAENQRTRTNLMRARRAEELARGKQMLEIEAKRAAARTREPPASWLRLQNNSPQYATQSEIVDEKRRDFRVAAGLTAEPVGTNPARPNEALSLQRADDPLHATRSQLLLERKHGFIRDGERILKEMDETHVPPEDRVRAREDFFIRYRAAGGGGRSRSAMLEERKREAIESGQKWGDELKPPPPKLCEDEDANFWQTRSRYEASPHEQSRKRYLAKVLGRHEHYNDYEDPAPDPFKKEHVLPKKVEGEDVFKKREVPVRRPHEERELVTSIPAIPAPPPRYFLRYLLFICSFSYYVSAILDEQLRAARANKPLRPLTISQFVDQFAREAGGMMRSERPPPGTVTGTGTGAGTGAGTGTGTGSRGKARASGHASGSGAAEETAPTSSAGAAAPQRSYGSVGSERPAPAAPAPPPPPAVQSRPQAEPPARPDAPPLPPPPAARSLAQADAVRSGGSAVRSGVRTGGFQLAGEVLAS